VTTLAGKNGNYPEDSPPKNWINAWLASNALPVIPLSAIMTGSAEQLPVGTNPILESFDQCLAALVAIEFFGKKLGGSK
jgi:hypothetical protein